MTIEIKTFINGPLQNNTYLLVDDSVQTVLIDPSIDCKFVLAYLESRKLELHQIWVTHAHFDHTIGIKQIFAAIPNKISITLHSADLPLWKSGGGGINLGYRNLDNPLPDILLEDGQILTFGNEQWKVLHTPGHTPGCVVYFSESLNVAFTGDTIFKGSIGRTDLHGGSLSQILGSINSKILTLPDQTILYPGHGEPTTVGEEKVSNPYLI